jgi:hypothetical protein
MDEIIRILAYKFPTATEFIGKDSDYIAVFNQEHGIAYGWRIGKNWIENSQAVISYAKEIKRPDRLIIIKRIWRMKNLDRVL